MNSTEQIPISLNIQAAVYRKILQIIKEKECGYEEAWKIFAKEIEMKLKEAEKRQHLSDEQKVDRAGDERRGVRKTYRTQRRVRTADASGK